jgi:hypothetical protein
MWWVVVVVVVADSDGSVAGCYELSGYIKCGGMSWLHEIISASEGGISCEILGSHGGEYEV